MVDRMNCEDKKLHPSGPIKDTKRMIVGDIDRSAKHLSKKKMRGFGMYIPERKVINPFGKKGDK